MLPVEDFMSDSHHQRDHQRDPKRASPDDFTHDDGPHEGPIKTPKQVILAVLFSLIVPILVIVLLVTQVTVNKRPAAGSDGLTAEATARRIHPVGMVSVKDPTDVAAMKTGEQVYNSQCVACHAAGAAGAPKFGDLAAWAPRITQGYEALWQNALKGKGAMGAQGGGDYSDVEIGRAVVYMANQGGAKFAEPALPGKTAAAESK
jgi:cytochrome c5